MSFQLKCVFCMFVKIIEKRLKRVIEIRENKQISYRDIALDMDINLMSMFIIEGIMGENLIDFVQSLVLISLTNMITSFCCCLNMPKY